MGSSTDISPAVAAACCRSAAGSDPCALTGGGPPGFPVTAPNAGRRIPNDFGIGLWAGRCDGGGVIVITVAGCIVVVISGAVNWTTGIVGTNTTSTTSTTTDRWSGS